MKVARVNDGWDWLAYTFDTDNQVSLHFRLKPIRPPRGVEKLQQDDGD